MKLDFGFLFLKMKFSCLHKLDLYASMHIKACLQVKQRILPKDFGGLVPLILKFSEASHQ